MSLPVGTKVVVRTQPEGSNLGVIVSEASCLLLEVGQTDCTNREYLVEMVGGRLDGQKLRVRERSVEKAESPGRAIPPGRRTRIATLPPSKPIGELLAARRRPI